MQECRCSRSQRIPCSVATGPITIEGSTTLAVGDESNKLQMLFLETSSGSVMNQNDRKKKNSQQKTCDFVGN